MAVVRRKPRDEALTAPQLTSDGKFHFARLGQCLFVAGRPDLVRLREAAKFVKAVEPILRHRPQTPEWSLIRRFRERSRITWVNHAALAQSTIPPGRDAVVWSDSGTGRMMPNPAAREVSMQRIGDMFHHRTRDDFGEGDHQEYVERGVRDILLIGGAAALLIGAFVISLV